MKIAPLPGPFGAAAAGWILPKQRRCFGHCLPISSVHHWPLPCKIMRGEILL